MKEYQFYDKSNLEKQILKLTDTYIELNAYDDIQIMWEEIKYIKFDIVVLADKTFKRLAMNTTKRFMNYRIDLDNIADVKELFDLLNNTYSHKTIIDADYQTFLNIKQSAEKNKKVFNIYFSILLFLFLLFMLHIFIGGILGSNSYPYNSSFDVDKTIKFSTKHGLICPRVLETINKTSDKNIFRYRYECAVNENVYILFESNLSTNESKAFEFEKDSPDIFDFIRYKIK